MALYKFTANTIEALKSTTFAAEGMKEREDLQRLLRDNIEVVVDDELVLQRSTEAGLGA